MKTEAAVRGAECVFLKQRQSAAGNRPPSDLIYIQLHGYIFVGTE